MTHDRPHLPGLRSELKSFGDVASAGWLMRSARKAFERGQWERASDRLEGLAEGIRENDLSRQAWRELVLAMLDVAVRGRLSERLPDIVANWAWRAWDPTAHDALPREISVPLSIAQEEKAWSMGEKIGNLFATHYVGLPVALYARAHFREMENIGRGKGALESEIARDFERAADLYTDEGDEEKSAHCRLRAGVTLLRAKTRVGAGRRLLRSVDANGLGPENRLWYALGMAHSPNWIDRVRAADAIEEIATGVSASRPEYRKVDMEKVRNVAEALFRRAVRPLQPAEEDRLSALLGSVIPEDRRGPYALRMEIGAALADRGDAELPEVRSFEDVLGADLSAREELATSRALVAAYRKERVDIPETGRKTTVGLAVTECLLRGGPTPEDLRLIAALLDDEPRARWTPLALLFSSILDEPKLDVEEWKAPLTDFVGRWAPRAPEPGYGWWALAARLHFQKCDRAGTMVTRRALEEQTAPPDEAVADFARTRSLNHVIREAPRDELLWWLERLAPEE